MKLRHFIMTFLPARLSHAINLYKNYNYSLIEPELLLVNSLGKDNSQAIDIGAHLGLFSDVMARNFCQVTAVEPQAKLCSYLSKLRIRNLKVLNMALSDSTGNATLRVPNDAVTGCDLEAYASIESANTFHSLNTNEIRIEHVALSTLDNIASNTLPVGLIKIDVEGHELAVINGGLKVIVKDKPAIIAEISTAYNPKYQEVFSVLSGLGYTHWKFDSNRSCYTPIGDPLKEVRGSTNYVFIHQSDNVRLETIERWTAVTPPSLFAGIFGKLRHDPGTKSSE